MAIPIPLGAILSAALKRAIASAAFKATMKGATMGARYKAGAYGAYARKGTTMGSIAVGKRGLTMAGQHGRHVVMGHLSKSTLGMMGGAASGASWARWRGSNRRKSRRSHNYNRRRR